MRSSIVKLLLLLDSLLSYLKELNALFEKFVNYSLVSSLLCFWTFFRERPELSGAPNGWEGKRFALRGVVFIWSFFQDLKIMNSTVFSRSQNNEFDVFPKIPG